MGLASIESIAAEVRDLFLASAFSLPEKALPRPRRALAAEVSPRGRAVLETIVENATVARESSVPPRQDTGLAQVILELGQGFFFFDGKPLRQAAEEGRRRAFRSGCPRKPTCRPPSRRNPGDNSPVSLETEAVPGDGVAVRVMVAGGGRDSKSLMMNLPPRPPWTRSAGPS
ncbi:MAG: fumarate hydratase [Deltaproteobacteria bacterium]|jgi:tartrate dehydratase alpha subunit/fumarate hydratase class I-like protein|nr:fumarate hydratase [Deltaproteobacteria bacterium]